MKFFSHFSQSSENSTGHVFHLFKLKFFVVTPLVLLTKIKVKKIKKIAGFRILLFGSRIDLCLVSTKSRVTKTFRKIGPPMFSSSGNQSFRYTIRFTSTLSFECFLCSSHKSTTISFSCPTTLPRHSLWIFLF